MLPETATIQYKFKNHRPLGFKKYLGAELMAHKHSSDNNITDLFKPILPLHFPQLN
jgi:hypothetical protein